MKIHCCAFSKVSVFHRSPNLIAIFSFLGFLNTSLALTRSWSTMLWLTIQLSWKVVSAKSSLVWPDTQFNQPIRVLESSFSLSVRESFLCGYQSLEIFMYSIELTNKPFRSLSCSSNSLWSYCSFIWSNQVVCVLVLFFWNVLDHYNEFFRLYSCFPFLFK